MHRIILFAANFALVLSLAPLANAQTAKHPVQDLIERKNLPIRQVDPSNKDPSITRENLDDNYIVPNLAGQNVNRIGFDSTLSRRSRGFTAKVSEEKNSTGLPKGQILSQSPKAGTQLRKPGEILLVVSSGR